MSACPPLGRARGAARKGHRCRGQQRRAQVSGAGDQLDDPSIAWPETRRLVKLGTITIDGLAADQPALDKALIFLPGSVPDGIAPADPMVEVRAAAYPVSFSERQ